MDAGTPSSRHVLAVLGSKLALVGSPLKPRHRERRAIEKTRVRDALQNGLNIAKFGPCLNRGHRSWLGVGTHLGSSKAAQGSKEPDEERDLQHDAAHALQGVAVVLLPQLGHAHLVLQLGLRVVPLSTPRIVTQLARSAHAQPAGLPGGCSKRNPSNACSGFTSRPACGTSCICTPLLSCKPGCCMLPDGTHRSLGGVPLLELQHVRASTLQQARCSVRPSRHHFQGGCKQQGSRHRGSPSSCKCCALEPQPLAAGLHELPQP